MPRRGGNISRIGLTGSLRRTGSGLRERAGAQQRANTPRPTTPISLRLDRDAALSFEGQQRKDICSPPSAGRTRLEVIGAQAVQAHQRGRGAS